MVLNLHSDHQNTEGLTPSITAEEILLQQQRILESPEFNATEAQVAFLKFVINKFISGESHEIKGYTVATQVFGRTEDFDQNTDPIVSIHANKLRRALERYYLTAGVHDPLRIDIPKGAYIPTFTVPGTARKDIPVSATPRPDFSVEHSMPSIMIRPFKCLTDTSEAGHISIGLATELAIELSRYQDFRVILQDSAGYGKRVSDNGIRFMIDGTLRNDGTGIRLSIYLIDTVTGTQLWGETHRFDLDASKTAAVEEKIARIVAVKVAGEYGIIAKTLSSESKSKPPSELKTYEAILRYYEFDRLLTPESFTRALAALEFAVTIEPDCGRIWSMLGRIYANIYSLELPGFETALEKAVAFAEKGAQLNPNNQRIRGILGLVRMFCNELPAAIEETEKALILNPNSLFILDGLAYLLTLLGEWKRGTAAIRKVIQLNPYYGLYVHYALWTDCIRQQDYFQAHQETMKFCRPSIFWEPLMKAATFGHLRRLDEGQQAARNLLELKPDFQTRGRTLIGHYIKFDDILERIVEGLSIVGVNVE